VFYQYSFDADERIYYWSPGTAWNPESESIRVLPFRGQDVLPSPDGKKAVILDWRQPGPDELQIVETGPASGFQTVRLPAGYTPHAWLSDSARLLVTQNTGSPERPVRGIFDLRNPQHPFRPFDWPDHFHRLIKHKPGVRNRGIRDVVNEGADIYVLRYLWGSKPGNFGYPVQLDRCEFAENGVQCQPIGQPVELAIGHHFVAPDGAALFFNAIVLEPGSTTYFHRYDVGSGRNEKLFRARVFDISPSGERFVVWRWNEISVHKLNACR
jgi:hypothetical protein